MKYYIDFKTKNDKYNRHITSLYFNNIEDFITILAVFKKHNFYKIYDYGTSYGWNEKDLINDIESLMKNDN